MKKNEFKEITELLEENYNKKLDLRIFDLWYQEFKDLPKEQYKAMVVDAIKQEKYMPNMARMKELKKPIWMCIETSARIATPEEVKELEDFLKEFKDEEMDTE